MYGTKYIIARNEVEYRALLIDRDEAVFVFLSWDKWEEIKNSCAKVDGDLWNPYGKPTEYSYDLSGFNIVVVEGGFDSPVYHDILSLKLKNKIKINIEWEPIV